VTTGSDLDVAADGDGHVAEPDNVREERRMTTPDGVAGRVVVVGPCASGKSTLVESLRSVGYDAVVSAQEHSDVTTLWRRSRPDALVGLVVDLETTSRRRGRPWPASLYGQQRERLAVAMSAAVAVIDTSTMTQMAVLAATTRALREHGVFPTRHGGTADVADRA